MNFVAFTQLLDAHCACPMCTIVWMTSLFCRTSDTTYQLRILQIENKTIKSHEKDIELLRRSSSYYSKNIMNKLRVVIGNSSIEMPWTSLPDKPDSSCYLSTAKAKHRHRRTFTRRKNRINIYYTTNWYCSSKIDCVWQCKYRQHNLYARKQNNSQHKMRKKMQYKTINHTHIIPIDWSTSSAYKLTVKVGDWIIRTHGWCISYMCAMRSVRDGGIANSVGGSAKQIVIVWLKWHFCIWRGNTVILWGHSIPLRAHIFSIHTQEE